MPPSEMYSNSEQQFAPSTIWDDPYERMNRLSHLRQSNETSNRANNYATREAANKNKLNNYKTTQSCSPRPPIDYIDSNPNPNPNSSRNRNSNLNSNPSWHLDGRSESQLPKRSIFDSSMTMAASRRASLAPLQPSESPDTLESRSQSQNSNQLLLQLANGNGNGNRSKNPAIANKDNDKLRKRARPIIGEDELFDEDARSSSGTSRSDTKADLTEPYSRRGCAGRCCATLARWLLYLIISLLVVALCALIIYFYPIEGPQFEHKTLPGYLPRPKFAGPWQVDGSANKANLSLDQAEALFEHQFHGPESMAWTSDKSAFYTGVEGGFILRIEPYAERWFLVARLNARSPPIQDLSHLNQWQLSLAANFNYQSATPQTSFPLKASLESGEQSSIVPFCGRDVDLYGKRAEFEPSLVRLSRCSRPLGLRLAPDDSHLFVSDSLSGLYKISGLLNATGNPQAVAISRLIKFHPDQNEAASRNSELQERSILFGDDLAVDWQNEIIYFTDCSARWNVRHLIWLMAENDDSGRVLQYNLRNNIIKPLGVGTMTPVRHQRRPQAPIEFDWRNLSFPNGIELAPDNAYFMLADLNNRRIIKHHLRGPLAGQSEFLIRVPGFPDNVRQGEKIKANLDPDSGHLQTYWAACACATADWDSFEIVEFLNTQPWLKKLALKTFNFIGWSVESLAKLAASSAWQDAGVAIRQIWFISDPYCTHSLVFQFDENGRVLQSIHAPNFSSKFKILSEVSQVNYNRELDKSQYNLFADSNGGDNEKQQAESLLYLGSVYYSFLGRLKLPKSSEQFIERTVASPPSPLNE